MQRIGKMASVAAAAMVLAVLTGGCASIKDHRGYLVDAALVDSVQPGIDNQTSVERSLGRPTFISQFGEPTWYYISVDTKQAAFTRPRTSQQLVMRIRFDAKGSVVAVDKAGMDKVVRLDPDGKTTPTLGRERSFFEDLFGNIGTVGAPGAAPAGGGGGSGPNGS
jgi:outer membrane protein assembly factor BamE (lipoprotein component of BamABCDE complex)